MTQAVRQIDAKTRTEAIRKYKSGFELNEQELRRLHDVADQQIKRALSNAEYETLYAVKFQNGATSEFNLIDEVFEGENWGSSATRLVALRFREMAQSPKTKIEIYFADPSACDGRESITYRVEGQDRDWVFVASSQISERISRVERQNFASALSARYFPLVFVLGNLLGLILFSCFAANPPGLRARANSIHRVREQWAAGRLHDGVDAILQIEDAAAAGEASLALARPVLALVAATLGVPIAFATVLTALRYLYPPYNFVWGEYQREYDKLRGRRRFLSVGLILTLLLSIIGNVLTKKLGF